MAFQTKKSVLAILEETTEGTPVFPSGATDFIALQEGFEVTPAFESLENAELTGSIGSAKSIQGFESPTASFSHYIRHSGVEGQEPGYGLLLEAALGAKDVNATEYNTIAGSTAGDSTTAAVVKVDAAEGANFERGEALLIKDATNGFSIRNVQSIATDDLTLGFNLDNAPGTAVDLGKAVLYKPGESHPTITLHDYRANEAAHVVTAGNRVTEMTIEANAGELVNGSFSFEGIESFYNPIVITAATNDALDFNDGGGEENATIAAATYKDPNDLADAIASAMNALTADVITVTFSKTTGKFTIATDGGTLSLLWNTGANTGTSIGTSIGFLVAADDTGATTYDSDNAQTYNASFTPSFDSADPLVAKNNFITLGDFDDNVCFSTRSVSVSLSNEKADELDVCAESGKAGSVITGREVTVEITANLPQHDADKFHKFHTNDNIRFMYNFGEKTAGDWDPGKSVNMYSPTMTISEITLGDEDGLVTLNMSLSAYVSSGLGEFYINFL